MPKQKDLKRLIRSRMEKTGESYTAARLHVVKAPAPAPPSVARNLAALAGMSDAAVVKATGRTWPQWLETLDAEGAAQKPHRQIVELVSSLGIASWWAQMVTVGYERIRGLRERGQRRGGGGFYEATKSRTFGVPVEVLFDAFANARKRRRWLPAKVTVKSSTPPKYMRMTWTDGRPVVLGFLPKGAGKSAKSMVAIAHGKLPDKSAAEAVKKEWAGFFDRLGELLA